MSIRHFNFQIPILDGAVFATPKAQASNTSALVQQYNPMNANIQILEHLNNITNDYI